MLLWAAQFRHTQFPIWTDADPLDWTLNSVLKSKAPLSITIIISHLHLCIWQKPLSKATYNAFKLHISSADVDFKQETLIYTRNECCDA